MTSHGAVLERRMPLTVGTRCVGMRISWLAREHGIRALVIKGEAASLQGLRAQSVSVDVDVLVAPSDHEKMLKICSDLGWHRRPESWSWGAFITHSVTLIREGWPCDLDVHRSFPGLFGDPETTFEALWERRTSLGSPQHPVDVPCVEDQLVILVAHALRSPDEPRSRSELKHLRALVDSGFPVSREAYSRAAERLGASASTAEFVGAYEEAVANARAEQVLWEEHRHAERHTLDWFALIQESGWRDRPRLLARAVWPTRPDLEASFPGQAGTPRDRVLLRSRRMIRAARALPHVVRSWQRSRSARRQLRESDRGQYGLALADNAQSVPDLGELLPEIRATGRIPEGLVAADTGASVVTPSLELFSSDDGAEWAYDPAEDDMPMELNESASEIIELLRDPRPTDAVVDIIATRYNLPRNAVAADISGFVVELLRRGILTKAPLNGSDS